MIHHSERGAGYLGDEKYTHTARNARTEEHRKNKPSSTTMGKPKHNTDNQHIKNGNRIIRVNGITIDLRQWWKFENFKAHIIYTFFTSN